MKYLILGLLLVTANCWARLGKEKRRWAQDAEPPFKMFSVFVLDSCRIGAKGRTVPPVLLPTP